MTITILQPVIQQIVLKQPIAGNHTVTALEMTTQTWYWTLLAQFTAAWCAIDDESR